MVALSWQSHSLRWGQGLWSENVSALSCAEEAELECGCTGWQSSLGWTECLAGGGGLNSSSFPTWEQTKGKSGTCRPHKTPARPRLSGSPALLWFYLAKINTSSSRLKCLSLVFLFFLVFPFLHIWAITHYLRCAKPHLLLIRIPPSVAIKQWWLPLNGDGNSHLIGVFSSALGLCGSLHCLSGFIWLFSTEPHKQCLPVTLSRLLTWPFSNRQGQSVLTVLLQIRVVSL